MHLDIHAVEAAYEPQAATMDIVDDSPSYAAGPPLSVDYAGDLSPDVIGPADADGGDLFDFRRPPKSDDDGPIDAPPPLDLDPDVAFPSFDLGDMSLPSADEVTSGANLAAALGGDAFDAESLGVDGFAAESVAGEATGGIDTTLGAEPGMLDLAAELETVAPTSDHELLTPGAGSAEELGSLELEWNAPADAPAPPLIDSANATASIDDLLGTDTIAAAPIVPDDVPAREAFVDAAPVSAAAGSSADVEMPIEDLLEPVAEAPATENPTGAFASLTSDRGEPDAARTAAATPADEIPAAIEPETERMAGWEMQRAHAERLLESGDRMGGVLVLEQVAAELERIGDLERALTIVDELIRLSPDSIRHHQKRVELAFRANDRAKLIDAYLELGDALFRFGEERKARAVYQRVLELAPDDPRARAAVESVSSMSPPAGSGAIQAIPAPQPAAEDRPSPPARPPAREHSTSGNGARSGNGVSAPPQSKKPAPLDRAVAVNGEFVDLGEWLRAGESPKSTRMVAEEKPPTGDEQADFQEMLKRFKQGIAENVDDEDYESHYDLGVAYKEMGLMDEAVAEFQKALRGTTHRVRSYEALGHCFVEKEQYQVAASVLSRAIALGEGDDHHLVGVLYLLGRATEALSKHGDALDYYQRVFAVDIEFRDVADRISAIERKAT